MENGSNSCIENESVVAWVNEAVAMWSDADRDSVESLADITERRARERFRHLALLIESVPDRDLSPVLRHAFYHAANRLITIMEEAVEESLDPGDLWFAKCLVRDAELNAFVIGQPT